MLIMNLASQIKSSRQFKSVNIQVKKTSKCISMGDLKARSVLITGAAMGLGLAAAQECAAQGSYLTLADYNEQALTDAKQN